MSMNRLVGLGIFVLSSSLLATFAACDNSATTTPIPSGTSDTSEAGGSSATSSSSSSSTGNAEKGGASNSSSTTSSSGSAKGGASNSGNGSSNPGGSAKGGSSSSSSSSDSSTGGTSQTSDTGSSTPPPDSTGCDASTDLIASAKSSETQNWIGGDPELKDDNPCGVQGAVYVYSDKGIDKNENSGDETVKDPAYDPAGKKPADRLSPCKDGKCCISGATSLWPKTDGKTDYTAEVWGGGLGISLNADKDGNKSLYDGPMKGVIIKTEVDNLPGEMRIKLTQSGEDANAPFATLKAGGETKIYFADQTQSDGKPVNCPTAAAWGKDNAYVLACKPAAGPPADVQVEIVGGDAAGEFKLCIVSVTPIL